MASEVGSIDLLQPIQQWMEDKKVSEIILNEPEVVFVEKSNQFEQHSVPEFDIKRLYHLFRLIANENQQTLNEQKPLLSGVLKNGARIQLVLPPASPTPAFAIRIKQYHQYTLGDFYHPDYFNKSQELQASVDSQLLEYLENQDLINFMELALHAQKNILISGATSSGKTSFLNACLAKLPSEERLIVLEDTPEVVVQQKNVLRLLAYRGKQSHSKLSMQDLLQCSLRLRPDRIIMGEARGSEALDYISAGLTGHGGCITTIHAENPSVALIRMAQMYKLNALPAMTDEDIYSEIQRAVDVIIQLEKTELGRCITSVYFSES